MPCCVVRHSRFPSRLFRPLRGPLPPFNRHSIHQMRLYLPVSTELPSCVTESHVARVHSTQEASRTSLDLSLSASSPFSCSFVPWSVFFYGEFSVLPSLFPVSIFLFSESACSFPLPLPFPVRLPFVCLGSSASILLKAGKAHAWGHQKKRMTTSLLATKKFLCRGSPDRKECVLSVRHAKGEGGGTRDVCVVSCRVVSCKSNEWIEFRLVCIHQSNGSPPRLLCHSVTEKASLVPPSAIWYDGCTELSLFLRADQFYTF
mmetsp:Transcript_51968/g.101777  ORF Transcript_51968/g.101777 Transcript_51968/m.101777 type:complete len:260 (+) Transcript_51968:586-1365(+)